MEEADRLADPIAVIDRGTVIARGTADELKARVGGERIELSVREVEHLAIAREALRSLAVGEIQVHEHVRRVTVPVDDGTEALVAALNRPVARGSRCSTSACADPRSTTSSSR